MVDTAASGGQSIDVILCGRIELRSTMLCSFFCFFTFCFLYHEAILSVIVP